MGVGGLLLGVAAILGVTYASFVLRRPARSAESRSLFQGIIYERAARSSPRPLMFHIIEIDLTAPGIGFLATPQGIDEGGKETVADTVPGFLNKHVYRLLSTPISFIQCMCGTRWTIRPEWVRG